MKKLFLIGLFLMLGLNQAFATAIRTEFKNLTISGTPINGTVISTNQTVTSDSIYQSGSEGSDLSAIAIQVASGGNVKTTIQLSYDNLNWFNPMTSNGQGVLTNVSTIDTSINSNTWIGYSNTFAPWVRFNITSSGGNSTITAESLWQDWS